MQAPKSGRAVLQELAMIQKGMVFEDADHYLADFSQRYNEMMGDAQQWRALCARINWGRANHHDEVYEEIARITLRPPDSPRGEVVGNERTLTVASR
jgi:hypothetical protein